MHLGKFSSHLAEISQPLRQLLTAKSQRAADAYLLPEYSWQMIGSDLFEVNGSQYLLIVDYFSRFPEIVRMHSTRM